VAEKTNRAGRNKSPTSWKNNSKARITSGDITNMIGISSKFAAMNKLITRDLNNNTSSPTFSLYSKDEISTYLENPYRYETQLRNAVVYIYGASAHFKRLIQYFVSLSDLSYTVSPYKVDPKSANTKTVNRNYRRVLNTLSSMSIKTQFPKILTVCLREDTFFGTMLESSDCIMIQQLPSDYCSISSVERGVINVTFNFSYFDSHSQMLEYYPDEFRTKYQQYQNNRTTKWIELDSPTSFAVKCNNDILDYSIPPFAGLLRELYDIEDYRQLKASKTALENYAMLAMRLPTDEDGNLKANFGKAKEFWQNLDAVLPEEVGSVLTPMDITKISFEKSNTGDTDTVAEAEEHMFSAAGVSSLLFNNEKASANALALSIKVDQALTFGIVKGIEDVINRYIQSQSYGKNFKVTFLDVSPFNRESAGDGYLKAASYGFPTICTYAASQGLGQAELDSMSFLEGGVLGLQDMFKPIQSSNQMSSSDLAESKGATDEGGAPKKDVTELTDSGEQSREDSSDWG